MDSTLSNFAEQTNNMPAVAGRNHLLIEPYGGKLINLSAPAEQLNELTAYANALPSLQLSARTICDLELLATGAFSPLDKFMNEADLKSVAEEMHLSSGHLFPIPITLGVEASDLRRIGKTCALRDAQNNLLAILDVEEIYEWNREQLAPKVFGTRDERHPLVAEMNFWGRFNISGRLRVLHLPPHPDFRRLRLTPAATRARLVELGNSLVVAFQTRNPLHRGHEEMTKRAISETGGTLLLHPVVGVTKNGDVDRFTRVRTYQKLIAEYYDEKQTLLALLPLAMRFAGPREALWHALIRRNYGATHFIVGRDHASPGLDSSDKNFYPPFAAQKFAEVFAGELGVQIVSFDEFVYLPDENRYEEAKKVSVNKPVKSLSGTEVREKYLNKGKQLPEWFSRPEIARILTESCPPKHRQGVCLWFTGLSGAGKSTTAELLTVLLMENGRQVTILDGDVVRTHLSQGLGFGKEDRDANVRRIGFVAAEIVRHGGTVVCAAVSPYRAARNAVRNMVGDENFVEIFVATPLDVCERRDAKGMYEKARRGAIKKFTGIDDPYEVPLNPELILDTINSSAIENARLIIDFLIVRDFIQNDATRDNR